MPWGLAGVRGSRTHPRLRRSPTTVLKFGACGIISSLPMPPRPVLPPFPIGERRSSSRRIACDPIAYHAVRPQSVPNCAVPQPLSTSSHLRPVPLFQRTGRATNSTSAPRCPRCRLVDLGFRVLLKLVRELGLDLLDLAVAGRCAASPPSAIVRCVLAVATGAIRGSHGLVPHGDRWRAVPHRWDSRPRGAGYHSSDPEPAGLRGLGVAPNRGRGASGEKN